MHIFKYLESVSWGVGSLIVIGVFIAFAVIGIVFVRKTATVKKFKEHHDVAGFVFANLGVLYAVLVGFIVVSVQQRFDRIQEIIYLEASILAQLNRDSEVFSEKDGTLIRTAIKNYVTSVINDEWPLMAEGQSSQKTADALNTIWRVYYDAEIKETKQQLWYAESISKLNQLMSSRLGRLMGTNESLGTEMWVSLIMGGLIIISFLWFFALESLTTHILMASMLAAVTAFLLFLIYSLDTSFSGSISIEPEAFKTVLNQLI